MSSKLFLTLAAFLAFIAIVASQGAFYLGNRRHPTLDGHCYDNDNDLTLKIDETIYPTLPGKCFKLYCRDDYVLQYNYCPRRPLPCTGHPDFSKPFPECCNCD
ncbi:uncharacterized protein LOC106084125 isoform X2 [Stomoxys calcitrans]|nr:uncharacterized protein LOC106084125 isoform X2 [Stomoxys calcitrans]